MAGIPRLCRQRDPARLEMKMNAERGGRQAAPLNVSPLQFHSQGLSIVWIRIGLPILMFGRRVTSHKTRSAMSSGYRHFS